MMRESNSMKMETETAPSTPNEEEQLENFEMATREIMDVFNDPFFEANDSEVEMEEIDF